MKIRFGLLAGVVGSLAASAAGCGSEDEKSCATWVERLKSAGAMDRSLDRIAELKCAEALPAMKDLFVQGQLQDRILQTTKQLGKGDDPATVEILRAALKTNKLANMAAGMAQDWKVAGVLPELTAIMTDPNLVSLREAAFPALLALSPDPKTLEDMLIGVASADPNTQSAAIFELALRELGNMGSVKALPVTLKLAYFKNNKGEEVFKAARRALAQIADPGLTPALVEVAAGKHKEVDDFTRALNVADWQGVLGAKSVQLLNDRLEPAVVQARASRAQPRPAADAVRRRQARVARRTAQPPADDAVRARPHGQRRGHPRAVEGRDRRLGGLPQPALQGAPRPRPHRLGGRAGRHVPGHSGRA